MSLVKPYTCIITPEVKFSEFPLIVSHSNFKRIRIADGSGGYAIGYQFLNDEDALKYYDLLTTLDIEFHKVSIMLPVDDSEFKKPLQTNVAQKVTVELVRKLRDETGLCLMECKKALTAAEGNLEKAKELVRRTGFSTTRLVSFRRD